ncbi:MAG: ShlB/FhaC/HecB family hemolysin secretion/activation protein [Proteobacteria bacterium]|nr:ShlB/FhaC/HecB family hemolysin secretion/activation protein [Pseudomonadota bacterium]
MILSFKKLTFLSFLLFPQIAFADSTQDIINQQDWLTRQQQNILEDKKRNLEFDAIKKEYERKKKEEEQNKSQPLVSGKMKGGCIEIEEIHLLDAKSLSKFRQKRITAPFIGKCMEAETLTAIIKAVTDYYHSQGYITTQVKVPKQNLQSGIFELQIIEGKIEKISLGKDRLIEKMQEFTAFGNAEGKTLNVDDINQGIYQMNRLQSNQAVMKVEPGSVSGNSKIIIDNNKKFPAKFTVGKDNLGNKFTGEQRTNFSSSFDNLLFLNDNLNLSYTANYHDDSSVKDLKSFSSSFSIPFKHNTFSYDFSHSEYKGKNPGTNGPSTLTGYSQSSKFTIDRVLLNHSRLRLSSNAAITEKQAASYIKGFKSESTERRLSVLNLGFAASSYLNDTTSIYLKPSYSKGLKVLNAKQDQPNEDGTTTKAQFEYFKLYANFSKRLTIPKTEIPFTFSTEMDSQYAKQTLYGSEQFSVGGYYSVRGFREGYITGDSGYYFRNKINVNLSSLMLPFIKKTPDQNSQSFLSKNLVYLKKISFEPFYDYGYTKYKYADNGADGRLSGTGLKTIFSSKYFTSSLTYSWATSKSRLITATTKENKLLYFEISANCC